jgi:hypothetical protein
MVLDLLPHDNKPNHGPNCGRSGVIRRFTSSFPVLIGLPFFFFKGNGWLLFAGDAD